MLFIVWVVPMLCVMTYEVSQKASGMANMACHNANNVASLSTKDALDKENDEACEYAKDTMTEQVKEKYEAAKEKASDAAGNLGQKMRTGSTEL